jgi:hypothetical protein
MNFPNAFKKVFVSDGTLAGAGTSADLTAGKIGFYDYKTNAVVTAAPGSGNQVVYLAQGSYHTNDKVGPFHGGYKESIKSKGINPKYVSRFFKQTAQTAQNQVVTLGWDKTPAGTSSPKFECGKSYNLRLDLKGSPILRFLNHQAYHTFMAYSGCCANDCSAGCTGDPVDAASVMLQWADQINADPIFGNFVQAKVFVKDATVALAAPIGLTATPATTGGTLAAGTYKVIVTAVNASGESLGSTEVSAVTTGATGSIVYAWTAVANAVSYKIYEGGTTGGENIFFTSGTNSFTYTGQAGVAGVPPTVNTAGDTQVQTATYVPLTVATDINALIVSLELTAAYVDTKFGNCSFSPTDHYELEPIFIYPSLVDETGEPCAIKPIGVITEIQSARQAMGVGETVVRDLILFLRYLQEPFQDDARLREVLNDVSLTAGIDRTSGTNGALYDKYTILHNVPRLNNSSSIFDNDQYLLEIVVPFGTNMTAFTTLVQNILNLAGNGVVLETF